VVRRSEKTRAKISIAMLIFVVSAISVEGCSTPAPRSLYSSGASIRPVTHVVQPGETIYHIAHVFGVSATRLMAANGLSDPHQLTIGQTLIIPTSRGTTSLVPSFRWPVARAERQFAWPVTAGRVSSPFGIRNGVMHDGVDIVAEAGTPVHAADNGVVIFAGRLRGYGNVVILQHSGGYVTVYGHNQRNLVAYGTTVARGQVIAELGATGRATGPNLHFEVRFKGRPQNPLAYLPPPQPGNGISFARNGGL
jgi:murein DD-endopeptidase MepM/ murein hydrolase activator NlpD